LAKEAAWQQAGPHFQQACKRACQRAGKQGAAGGSATGAAAPRLRVGLQHGALRDGQVGAQARELVLRQAQLHGRHLLLLAQEAHDLLQLAACAMHRQRAGECGNGVPGLQQRRL